MKKWISVIVVACFAGWIVGQIRAPKPVNGFDLKSFGELPVVLNGRVQPLDSVARNSLLAIRTKQTANLEPDKFFWEKPKIISATEWFLDVTMKPEEADTQPVFRIDHPDLKGLLKLPEDKKYFSFKQIGENFEPLEKEAQRVSDIKPDVRNPFERSVAGLAQNLQLYFRLKNSLKPEGAEDFAAEVDLYRRSIGPGLVALQKSEAGEDADKDDLSLIVRFFRRYESISKSAYPLIVPLQSGEKADDWANVGASLMSSVRSGEIHPAVTSYAAMATAFHKGNPVEFNQAVAKYQEWLNGKNLTKEIRKAGHEYWFNLVEPFYLSMVVYVTAFLLGLIFWLNWSPTLRQSAYALLCLALTVHTIGLIYRIYLTGRPPVTNLYSSAVFIGWVAVMLGVILERFFKNAVGIVVAGFVGFATLIIAHHLALSGDTMELLQAVLDTNFWLATHVVVVTAGYASMFIAGVLGIIYIFMGLFTRNLAPAPVKTSGKAAVTPAAPDEFGKSLARMVYGIVCFATLASFVGTILGGIWADQSWGRFWGWDVKENGALMIVLWNAVVLHARWGGMIKERGLMAMAVFGNIVTSFSWFGVNMLGVGLHSYGFMDKAFPWLIGFVISQALIIALALIPLHRWKSFAGVRAEPAKDQPTLDPGASDATPANA